MKVIDFMSVVSNQFLRYKVIDKSDNAIVFYRSDDVDFIILNMIILNLYYHNNGFCDFVDLHVDGYIK